MLIVCLLLMSVAAAVHADPKSDGEEYLRSRAREDGVHTCASGLLYKVLTPGSGKGKSPRPTDDCDVHYKGTFINGEKFDSSYDRGTPATFKPTQVIAGWTEALQMMCEGDKWLVYVPFQLAYGEAGQAPIPAYSTLVFEIALLKVWGTGTACASSSADPSKEEGGDPAEAVQAKEAEASQEAQE